MPFGDRLVVSYPDKTVGDYLVNTLTGLAANPNEPDVDAARDAYSAIDFYDPDRDDLDLDEQLAEIIDQLSERGTVRSDPGRPDLGIAQTLLLNEPIAREPPGGVRGRSGGRGRANPRGPGPRRRAPPPEDPPEPPQLDFHKAVGAAAAHPYLMRLLGLVVDFEFTPPPELPGGSAKEARRLFQRQARLAGCRPARSSRRRSSVHRCLVSASVRGRYQDPRRP